MQTNVRGWDKGVLKMKPTNLLVFKKGTKIIEKLESSNAG